MALRELVGVPFVDGGRDPKVGLDCWGLVMAAMREFGHEVPDFKVSCFATVDIHGIFTIEARGWDPAPPGPGVCVAFENDPRHPGHVQHFGTCIDALRFLHTLRGTGSCVERLDNDVWVRRIRGVYRWRG